MSTSSAGQLPEAAADTSRLREDFEHYDLDGDGLIEYGEFVRFLSALEAGMSEEECRIGFAEVDADRDGVIEFEEFQEWWETP